MLGPPAPVPPTPQLPEAISDSSGDEAMALCNANGCDRLLAEGPTSGCGTRVSRRPDWADIVTPDEEFEFRGMTRPKKGGGWWGVGPR